MVIVVECARANITCTSHPSQAMSNNSTAAVRDLTEVDPRIARTTHALGQALIELIQERDFAEITVQNILDRAGVGRTTFYAHYRNKEDVLHSSYEQLFSLFEALLERPSPAGYRLFPVSEFLAHVGDANAIVAGLRSGGRLEEAWALFTGYAASIIERRLQNRTVPADVPKQLIARMLAGALMQSLEWWTDHPASATPARMDAAFHELARGYLQVTPSASARTASGSRGTLA